MHRRGAGAHDGEAVMVRIAAQEINQVRLVRKREAKILDEKSDRLV